MHKKLFLTPFKFIIGIVLFFIPLSFTVGNEFLFYMNEECLEAGGEIDDCRGVRINVSKVSANNEKGLVNCTGSDGGCTLVDFERLIIKVANFILGISGSVTLLFFIYGGVVLLTSAGSSKRVTQGKGILLNSVIGLAIIFCSYLIIQFTITALKGEPPVKGLEVLKKTTSSNNYEQVAEPLRRVPVTEEVLGPPP